MFRKRVPFTQSARALLRREPESVTHSLTCASCGLRSQGLLALALAGWTEDDWYADLYRRMEEGEL